ncbi:helix-turn-helix domain-containing protein [Streptomyces sp. RFCAC02]|uniref:winged helix-turn-helix transcriptional regulator n=1 Tax=Streptomyces sp. RFCAC02 TaxID=2499143 RepID=UPI00102201FB|nr:helix-turn-helix domain-containing protein [Streptomyces sp. RFCAC02]
MVRTRRPGAAYGCALDAALGVVGARGKVLVLWALDECPRDPAGLRRALPDVADDVLAAHLRELEEDGVVRRDATGGGETRYALTPAGAALSEALVPLGAWGREHVVGLSAYPPPTA